MSVAYAEPASPGSAQWTGATLYDPALVDPEEYRADQRRTHIAATGIHDPVLRDTLANFENVLIRKLTRLVGRAPTSRRTWLTPSLLSTQATESFNQFELASGYPALAATVTLANASLCDITNVVAPLMPDAAAVAFFETSVTAFFGEYLILPKLGLPRSHDAGTAPASFAISASDEVANYRSADSPLAVQAVEDVADWLGVPVADVLRAAGIVKRTYQEWKRSGTRRPRISSEGRLWELHHLAADLVETMGLSGVRHWFRLDPARRRLLRAGALDRLVTQAYNTAKTSERPPWVGVGSVERHALPPRKIILPRMDPGDVSEPKS